MAIAYLKLAELKKWIERNPGINPERYNLIHSREDKRLLLRPFVTTSRVDTLIFPYPTGGEDGIKNNEILSRFQLMTCEKYQLEEDRGKSSTLLEN